MAEELLAVAVGPLGGCGDVAEHPAAVRCGGWIRLELTGSARAAGGLCRGAVPPVGLRLLE
jgi:hypothetical protein